MTDEEFNYWFRDADPRQRAYYRMMRDEYRKKHPLTNFEKWKEGLGLEEVMKKLDASNLVCDFCPARCACNGTYCKDHFVAWANATAEEEE